MWKTETKYLELVGPCDMVQVYQYKIQGLFIGHKFESVPPTRSEMPHRNDPIRPDDPLFAALQNETVIRANGNNSDKQQALEHGIFVSLTTSIDALLKVDAVDQVLHDLT